MEVAVHVIYLLVFIAQSMGNPNCTNLTVGIIEGEGLVKLTTRYLTWNSSIHLEWRSIWSRQMTLAAGYKLLHSRVNVLISRLTCDMSRHLASLTEYHQIPHLSITKDPCQSTEMGRYTLYMLDWIYHLPDVIKDVVNWGNWRKVTLLSDNNIGHSDMFMKNRIVRTLSRAGVETLLETTDSFVSKHWPGPQIVILMTNSNVNITRLNEVIKRAREKNPFMKWLIACESGHITEHVFTASDNSLAIIHPFNTNSNKSVISCIGRLVGILEEISVDECQLNSLPSNSSTTILNHVQKKFNDDPFMCSSEEYKISLIPPSDESRVRSLGIWTSNSGLTPLLHNNKFFQNTNFDFHGIELRITVNFDQGKQANGTSSLSDGFIIDILDDLATSLNFRYSLVEAQDGYYGYKLENGSWTGMIGMVMRKEVDLGAAAFSITADRANVVDFTTPFMHQGLTILTSKPLEKSDMFQAFKPFSLGIWSMILLFCSTTSISLVFMMPLEGSEQSFRKKIQNSVFHIISAFFQQGLTSHPDRYSARCLLGFWFFFTLLIMAMYTADLAAVLTVSMPVQPINSLEDLAFRSDVPVVVEYGTSIWSMFKESRQPAYQAVGKRLVGRHPHDVDMAASGKVCIVGDRLYLTFYNVRTCGETRLAEHEFQPTSLSFILPKNSPYKAGFDVRIQEMMEAGIIEKMIDKWISFNVNCTSDSLESIKPRLQISRLAGIFALLGGTYVMAMFVLIGEIRIARKRWFVYLNRETN